MREVVGVGRSRENLDVALGRGVVDRAFALDDDWTRECAMPTWCCCPRPVAQFAALFAAMAPALGADTVVTDAGSTKQDVIAAARAGLGRPRCRASCPGIRSPAPSTPARPRRSRRCSRAAA